MELDFQWLLVNIVDGIGNQFEGIKFYEILIIFGMEGGELKVGILVLIIDSNVVDYVIYSDFIVMVCCYIDNF